MVLVSLLEREEYIGHVGNMSVSGYSQQWKKMKTNDSVDPLINDNGDVLRDRSCAVSMLNKYFASAFFQQKILIIFHLSILKPIVA